MPLVCDLRGGASRDAVERFERVADLALPGAYRHFLSQTNGGRFDPEPELRSVSSGEVITLLSGLFGLNRERYADLEANFEAVADALGTGLLPIGHDPGGNLIVLACDDPHQGEVFFVSLERLEGRDLLRVNELICVAKSFADILSLAGGARDAG